MKKILVTLLVAALCAPAMAATVSFADNGDGTGTFTITATELIVGVGLDVTASANVTAVSIDTPNFNIYPDAGYDLGAGYTYGAGSPVANPVAPGQATLPLNAFALSFGNLNGSATPGADGSNTVVITFTAGDGTTVTIAENALRSGVVGTLGEDIDLVADGTTIPGPALSGTITAGCSGFPCCVDYNLTNKKDGGIDPVVNVSDINSFIGYVNGAKNGSLFIVGPADPDYDADYNFDPGSAAINVSDLNNLIGFVNGNKAGSLFIVNCNTCGC